MKTSELAIISVQRCLQWKWLNRHHLHSPLRESQPLEPGQQCRAGAERCTTDGDAKQGQNLLGSAVSRCQGEFSLA